MSKEEAEVFKSQNNGIYYYISNKGTKETFTNSPNNKSHVEFSSQDNIVSLQFINMQTSSVTELKNNIESENKKIALRQTEQPATTKYTGFTGYVYIDKNAYGIQVEVVGTNENFAQMANLKMTVGSFFNGINVNKKSNVVVLSSAAAWHFFGNTKAAGSILNINNDAYQVIGIFENASANKGKLLLYMPFRNLNGYFPGSSAVTDLWMGLEDISEAQRIVSTMGMILMTYIFFK